MEDLVDAGEEMEVGPVVDLAGVVVDLEVEQVVDEVVEMEVG